MKHSHLSASSAHRWIKCPGSVGMSMDIPRQDSDASLEGTRAHEIAEMLLNGETPVNCDPDMLSHCEAFRDYVLAIPGQLNTEMKVKYGAVTEVHEINGKPDSFGTADVIVIGDDGLHIVDFKYGMGKVYAEMNPQLMLYALGALDFFYEGYDGPVSLHIFQPRIDWVDVWQIDDRIYEWADEVKVAAKKVVDGIRNVGRYLEVGDHCTWCPARGSCPALSDDILDMFDNPHLEESDYAEILTKKKLIKNWLDSVEAAALLIVEAGGVIPGFKLGQGREGNRKWSGSVDEILSTDVLYKTEVRTPSEIEKILPRRDNEAIWQELDQYIGREPAKQVLVPDTTSETNLKDI